MRSVTVKFLQSTSYGTSKCYEYFIPEGLDPLPGDLVLTSTYESCARDGEEFPSSDRIVSGAGIARVVSVNPRHSSMCGKYFLALMSVKDILAQRVANRKNHERLRKADELLEQMRAIAANDDEITRFKAMSRTNPEIRKLLKAYEQVA